MAPGTRAAHSARSSTRSLRARQRIEDRRVAARADEDLQQIEERRLRPLEVVEDRDQWALAGDVLQQLAERPERLLHPDGRVGEPRRRGDPFEEQSRFLGSSQDRAELRSSDRERVVDLDARELPHRLGHRPERDAFTVREAPAGEGDGTVLDPCDELRGQARLPSTGAAEHAHEPAGAIGDHAIEGSPQQAQLLISSHEPRLGSPRGLPNARDARHPIRGHRHPLPFEHQGARFVDFDGSAHELIRVSGDQDVPRRRGLLEPRGDVHRVPDDRWAFGHVGHEHLAGAHARPGRERDTDGSFEFVVQRRQCGSHVVGSPDRSERVVLVQLGGPEHRHHRVTDVLLDGATVSLEHAPHLLEEPSHDAADDLRIELVAQRGEPDEVAEDDVTVFRA